MAFLDGSKGVKDRASFGIVAYIGPNGSGKTLHAVADVLPALDAGRPVLSTVRLLDYDDPRPCDDPHCDSPSHPMHLAAHPLWVPFRGWDDLLEARGCEVLMDEVTGIASSRESMSLPGAVANHLVQLRRAECTLRWTAPSWRRADTLIRECTQVAVVCKGMMAREVKGHQWATNTVVRARVLDARELDEVTATSGQRERPLFSSFARVSKMPAVRAYDTFDQVMRLPLVEGGRCMVCGGRRRVPQCKCADGSHDGQE